ncbi:MAG TPA: septal ring lytic transglycosylase RlpA family protein [Candidatus Binatia bacterium]|nr:septal ring lytic transglycosylase RlpA family protein [Candidatus Binatia bacterium]
MAGLLLAAVSCSKRNPVRSDPPPPEASRGDFFESGVASWYGADFHGKTTANGEVYDMHKLTAAHQTLPFHSLVEVENLENGKKVLVRINDRGPFLKNRVIDLSLQAAQRLDMTGKGTAAVNIRVVRLLGALPAADGAPAGVAVATAECCVQFGAFAVRENADDLIPTLAEIFPDLRFRVVVEDGIYKVLSENLSSASRCRQIVEKAAEYRLQGFVRSP